VKSEVTLRAKYLQKLGLACVKHAWWIWFDSFYVPRCQHDDGYIRLYRRSVTDKRPHRGTETGSQRSVFPDGHPSKYWTRSTFLNFSERATELALVVTVSLNDGSGWVIGMNIWVASQLSQIIAFVKYGIYCSLNQTSCTTDRLAAAVASAAAW